MAARDREMRSVYVRGGWVQVPAAEGDYFVGGVGGHAVSGRVRDGYTGHRDSIVQTDAVECCLAPGGRVARRTTAERAVLFGFDIR